MTTLLVTGVPLIVNPASSGALAFAPNVMPDATEGTSYLNSLGVISGGVAPYFISLPTDVPSGLSVALDQDGVDVDLTGTPDIGSSSGDPYNVGFTITDSANTPATLSVRRAAAPVAAPRIRPGRTNN